MKEKIADACVRLVRVRSMDEITVSDVANECGISRQTFYYYFENIDTALLYAAEEKIELLKQQCMELEDPEEVVRLLVRSYRNQFEILRHLIQSKARTRVKHYYHETLCNILKAQLARYCRQDLLEPGELEVKASFTAYGLGGLLYERCSDPELDADELADEVYRFILRDVGRAFIKKEV